MAQEYNHSNLYTQNSQLFSPAALPLESDLSAFANSHLQWVGFDDAPRTNTFGVNTRVNEKMGVGLFVQNTQAGIINEFVASLVYNYRVELYKDHFLHLGLSAGFTNNSFDNPNSYSDQNDVTIINSDFVGTTLRSGFGISYFYKNLSVELSMPHFYRRSELDLYSMALVSYDYTINKDWELKPSVMLRFVETSPTQLDFNLLGEWKQTIWAQFSYRTNNSYLIGIGVNYTDYSLGYMYQINSSTLATVANGTHEIQLMYRLPSNLKLWTRN